ncbi:uncharacterized protein DUF2017 [Microterricola gilva]|uniref:Uncharacterized protein DUF2017 n=1 Tax=Microterricola gilva TaxID=393267 RepID=A0A4Q8AH60_9MICO|nr:DUF2017 family protein [Microterricola gilva]RZU63722.1 uncharacterized protein DUF2017 [Microterricola gilva]
MSRITAAGSRSDLLASGGTRAVLLQFDEDEAEALASLAAQIESLLSETDPAAPELTRLFPVAYSDDASAAAEFARYTRPELQKRKIDAAVAVREAVEAASALGIDDERYTHNIELGPDAVLPWLTFLTDLRLVLADSIGVDDDGSIPDAADAASEELAQLRELQHGVYDWAAFLQDSLVSALEDELP